MADFGPLDRPSGSGPAAVLIVDDDAAKRLALRALLTPLGHPVVEADSGRAALRAVVSQTFAVILIDVRMPIMDGYETAKLIRQRSDPALTPIIFVTAFGPDEIETVGAYASGAVDFLFTPIVREALQAKVSVFVELFVQSQALQRSLASITMLNATLRDSEVRVRAVLENLADGIVTAGEAGLIESFNGSARRLFGYREEEVIGQRLQILIAPSRHEDFPDPTRAVASAAQDAPSRPHETLGRRKDGSHFPIEIDMSRMQIGKRAFVIGCLRDISGRKAYTEALERGTLHDELTGLPNRTLFIDRMDRAIAFAERSGEPCGLLLVDLDRLGESDEVLGREKADALLQAAADRLRGTLRDSDTVARLGGDAFAILPLGDNDVGTATIIAWKVHEAFESPLLVNGHVLDVRASIGIAFFPQHGRTSADLLRRAELAMHDARRSRSGLSVFGAEPDDRAAGRLTLLSELRDCIPRGELVLHYQPKIDLAAARRTTGVEALVRWRHPTNGLLMPAQFMRDAERSELIEPLTRWVLDEALRQQRAWSDAGST